MNTLFAARALKRILGLLLAKFALRNTTILLFPILNECLTLNLPLLMNQQAESMNILFFSSLNARLNKQTLLIVPLADNTEMGLALFFNSLADVFASLAFVLHFLAVFMHSHSAFYAGFDWIVDLVVVAKTS